MPDTVAWATWKNRWSLFEPNGQLLLDNLIKTGLINKFNLNGKFDFENMLRAQINGKVSSWAIRWTAVAVLNDTLTLYPKQSLTKHIGFGKDSTNCEADDFNKDLKLANESISNFNIDVIENLESIQSFINFEIKIKNSKNGKQINTFSVFNMIKPLISKYIPNSIKSIFRVKRQDVKLHGWFGNYDKWEDVEKDCTGYDSSAILDSVKTAILKVRNGEAVYERDSVLFDKIHYSQPLLSALEQSIIDDRLHIVDFGGSLGSSYFQNRNEFSKQLDLKWSVVEQEHFVKVGKNSIAIDNLYFFNTVLDALKTQKNQVLLLSSVIQYFKEPYELINIMLEYNFDYIIIDRTAFIDSDTERITKQIVPEFIYKASYPAWFLNEKKFLDAFTMKYELLNDFMSAFDPEEYLEDGLKVYRKGFYFKKRS
jgi:putative methyltransferase (TIGR04325 family)